MGTDSIITLFFLVVAALIFLNLRSVLGRRTGNEKQPFDPFSGPEGDRSGREPIDGKVVNVPRPPSSDDPDNRYQVIDEFVAAGTELNKKLRTLYDADPTFNPREFISGAKSAYEMVVTAFAEGDRRTLKMLLSNEVFDGFNAVIAEREKAGEKVKFSFVGIEKIEMTDAGVSGSEATITLKIVSQLISATLDKAGEVLEGNPDTVAEVNDRWTFMRDTRSRDPNWKLVATQSEA